MYKYGKQVDKKTPEEKALKWIFTAADKVE
jgi:hypothetical protein